MGMFDSVWATCPNCKNAVEFQSKAGECELNDYSMRSVPPEIARDLIRDSNTCSKCGIVVRLRILKDIARVRMETYTGDTPECYICGSRERLHRDAPEYYICDDCL